MWQTWGASGVQAAGLAPLASLPSGCQLPMLAQQTLWLSSMQT